MVGFGGGVANQQTVKKKRRIHSCEFKALSYIRSRIERDRDVVEIRGTQSTRLQTPADGFRRESRPVFNAIESFFLDRSDQLTVD